MWIITYTAFPPHPTLRTVATYVRKFWLPIAISYLVSWTIAAELPYSLQVVNTVGIRGK